MILDTANFVSEPDQLPSGAGAYLLRIDLHRPVSPQIPRLGPITFTPGRYIYAGSARGPGGIRARARRHLADDKRVHWHVDHLTLAATSVVAAAFPGNAECALVRDLIASNRVSTPVLGFGSSDCRTCVSHLVRID